MRDSLREIVARLYNDRELAHHYIFAHRRPETSPEFHKRMIRDWHNPAIPYVLDLVFRGGAKSTIAEEAITLLCCFRDFKNGLVIGENSDRAVERLRAIKHEIESNDKLREVFGDLRGPTWAEDEVILSNGVRLLALGKGQALRGIKHHDARPDMVFCDDLETREEAEDPKRRQKLIKWFFTVLVPACDTRHRIRMAATPLDPESLAVSLTRDPMWVVHHFPIRRVDERGVLVSAWPSRYSLEWIEKKEESMRRHGLQREFSMEYMCQAVAPETQAFTKDMFRVRPQVRTWQSVYCMFDPARTVKESSALTGYAAWSWIGPKLVVWDSWARRLMPDEIVKAIFNAGLSEELQPTLVGVEEDGLNEFLMQPIRTEMVRRGVTIPVKAMKAPRNKTGFIRALQPYFKAREVEFVKRLPALEEELEGFPTGKIDAPNALAYATLLRPGAPIYEDFSARHVTENPVVNQQAPLYLALNAAHNMVSGVLVQYNRGQITVFWDAILEGDVATVTSDLIDMAFLALGRKMRLIGGPLHFDQYNNVGLKQAITRIPGTLDRGGQASEGRAVLRKHLKEEVRGFPALQVAPAARWTLNGFSSGYARQVNKKGIMAGAAEEGFYRVLMEGLESWAVILEASAMLETDDAEANFRYTNLGQRYMSALR